MNTSELNLTPDRKELICTECGGMMMFKGRGTFECDNCGHIYVNDFGRIKNYLEKKGRATVQELSAATGISTSKVMRLLKEGRIMLTPDSQIKLHCDCCGRIILHGTICDRCSMLVNRGEIKLGDDGNPIETASGVYNILSQYDNGFSGMRFVNNQSERQKNKNKK